MRRKKNTVTKVGSKGKSKCRIQDAEGKADEEDEMRRLA